MCANSEKRVCECVRVCEGEREGKGWLSFSLSFRKMHHPRTLFYYFQSFHTNNASFKTSSCKKCPSSIRCWGSNPRPLEHESSPVTKRGQEDSHPCKRVFVETGQRKHVRKRESENEREKWWGLSVWETSEGRGPSASSSSSSSSSTGCIVECIELLKLQTWKNATSEKN